KPPLLAHRHRHVVDSAPHGHGVLRHHEHVHPAGEVRQILGEGAVRNHHFGSLAVAEQARRGVIDPDHVIPYGTPPILMRRAMASRWPNKFSASLVLTTATWLLAASSRWENERPGWICPPSIFGQSALRPRMLMAAMRWPSKSMSAAVFSSTTTKATEGSCPRRAASSMVSGGRRRHGSGSSGSTSPFPPQ